MKARASLLIAFTIILARGAACSDAPMDRATLRGLKAVKAVVDAPASVAMDQAGITVAKLIAQMEQRLAKAGIPVDANAREFVGLRVSFAHGRKTDYALGLTLAVYQSVTLVRDPAIKTMAETWSGESILLVPPRQLAEAMLNTVDQLVDQFVEAYRGTNPADAK